LPEKVWPNIQGQASGTEVEKEMLHGIENCDLRELKFAQYKQHNVCR